MARTVNITSIFDDSIEIVTLLTGANYVTPFLNHHHGQSVTFGRVHHTFGLTDVHLFIFSHPRSTGWSIESVTWANRSALQCHALATS